MLILKCHFNISDEVRELQVNDRRSFEEFIGLDVINSISNTSIATFFRESLRKARVTKSLLAMFEAYLRSQVLGPVVVRMRLLFLFSLNAGFCVVLSTQYPRGEQRNPSRPAAGRLG